MCGDYGIKEEYDAFYNKVSNGQENKENNERRKKCCEGHKSSIENGQETRQENREMRQNDDEKEKMIWIDLSIEMPVVDEEYVLYDSLTKKFELAIVWDISEGVVDWLPYYNKDALSFTPTHALKLKIPG
jgi:hypothetical protein